MQEDRVRLIRNQERSRMPGRVLYSAREIESAVKEVAGKIGAALDGAEPTLLILLKGGARFGCDLVRALPVSANFDFIGVSSYGDNLSSSGSVDFYHYRLDRELIDNRTVVLVDDICDSGTTFSVVAGRLRADYTPACLLTCALILREGAAFTPDFHGIHHVGSEYLVGYGLGAGEKYRDLNDICALGSEL